MAQIYFAACVTTVAAINQPEPHGIDFIIAELTTCFWLLDFESRMLITTECAGYVAQCHQGPVTFVCRSILTASMAPASGVRAVLAIPETTFVML